MSLYKPLFDVRIEHGYFVDGRCKNAGFAPTEKTWFLLNRLGLVFKSDVGRLAVYYADDLADRLGEEDGGFRLSFRLVADDPYFSQYTHPSMHGMRGVLYCDSNNSTPEVSGKLLLHPPEYVSDADFRNFDSPDLADILEVRDYLLNPAVFVCIRIGAPPRSGEAAGIEFKRYVVRFASRESYWKYYIFGDLANRRLNVVDLDDRISFEEVASANMPGNKAGVTFVSTSLLPMRENAGHRFQLMERRKTGEKIVIGRLPHASVKRVNQEVVNGKGVFFSEIYVNC